MKIDLQPVTVQTIPFKDQEPGTSGLRKKTKVFLQPNYLENFIQSVFDVLLLENPDGLTEKTLVVGGDGRYHNRPAIQSIIKMAAANGFGRVLVAKEGILSTPAASAVIRSEQALGGFILSASHNPGGLNEDFGVKFNPESGGPAPQEMTERIYQRTKEITTYLTLDYPEININELGTFRVAGTEVVVFNALEDYARLMQQLFDFDAIRALFSGVFKFNFDAMNAVTGPYARYIFEEVLGAPPGTVLHGTPLEDFGGMHPDPNLKHAAELVRRMSDLHAPDFAAASDGDGDRNLILGRSMFVSPGDSLAIITEHAQRLLPGYRGGLAGVARSMPTSTAADRVAKAQGVPSYETPTGWKFFVNLMDAGMCTICGEESFGTGSNHVREKDGLWAVLCWLSILAKTGKSVEEIVHEHWARFGRSYYQRHDFEGLDAGKAKKMIAKARGQLSGLKGQSFGGSTVSAADDFRYEDPVSGTVAEQQGLRIILANGSRVVFRLSGTGTEGATLRVYYEAYRKDGGTGDIQEVLKPLRTATLRFLELKDYCGIDTPTVIT